MYKVAICDDEITYHEIVKSIVMHCKDDSDEMVFYEYYSGRQLLDNAWQQHDLVFLDIQMPGLNGNETAKLLRELNRNTVLIFCTNYVAPTPESFKVRPYRYIIKDLSNRMLKEEMYDILKEVRYGVDVQYLNVVNDGCLIRILINSILYIAVAKHGSKIYLCGDEPVLCRKHIKELYIKMSSLGFEYAHNSYIVNLSNIIKLEKNVLILKDDIQLNISRSKREQFDKSFSKLLQTRYRRE